MADRNNTSSDNSNSSSSASPNASQCDKNKKLFPQKLWELLHDARHYAYLRWSSDGQKVYLNRDLFETNYLKTSSNQFHTQKAISFVRQMNMYGFRKVDDCFYENDNFKRDCHHLLKNMVRRHSNKNVFGVGGGGHVVMSAVAAAAAAAAATSAPHQVALVAAERLRNRNAIKQASQQQPATSLSPATSSTAASTTTTTTNNTLSPSSSSSSSCSTTTAQAELANAAAAMLAAAAASTSNACNSSLNRLTNAGHFLANCTSTQQHFQHLRQQSSAATRLPSSTATSTQLPTSFMQLQQTISPTTNQTFNKQTIIEPSSTQDQSPSTSNNSNCNFDDLILPLVAQQSSNPNISAPYSAAAAAAVAAAAVTVDAPLNPFMLLNFNALSNNNQPNLNLTELNQLVLIYLKVWLSMNATDKSTANK